MRFAQINLQDNKVITVVVSNTENYLIETIGGHWVETQETDNDTLGAGPLMGYDPDALMHFAPDWVQPIPGIFDGYSLGSYSFHDGLVWQSLIDANVWEPGVFGWRDRTNQIPKWVQPLGAQDAFSINDEVIHNDSVWRSVVNVNVWEPGAQGITQWDEIPSDEPVNEWPNWVQPVGAHDAYLLGAKVTHNGQRWINTGSNANVWAPGVFGWTVQP